MVVSGDLFIFYGLLKQGAAGAPAHIPLDKAGVFLGPCEFEGEMFDAGGYPGVRVGVKPCMGQLYRLDDISILPALDAFEDCDMADPDASLYQRRRVTYSNGPADTSSGMAWVYWYVAPSSHMPLMKSGNWPLDGVRKDRGVLCDV